MSYWEFRPNVFYNNEDAIHENAYPRTLEEYYKYAFNEFDLLPDSVRKELHGLHIFTEKEPMNELYKTPQIIDPLNNYEEIFTKLNSDEIYIFPGDYFHSNEVYPWKTKRRSRHRMYSKNGKAIKYEVTKDVLHKLSYKGTSDKIFSFNPYSISLSSHKD